ncbi:MAG: hypothetical protein M9890_07175 [Thermomicrobiales bacterium]|nr:hypothetical protein [Thermomicrobiales bacterium]
MEPADERDLSTPIYCTNCGAPNARDAVRCHACGSWLPSQEQIIDVTTGEPEVVSATDERQGGQGRFQTMTVGSSRIVVARGGSRTCLLIAIVALLVGCCVCWVIWSGFGAIF